MVIHGYETEHGNPSPRSRLTQPLRHPEQAPPGIRSKRAFSLLALTLVAPGSAQLVAGSRVFARRALTVTFAVWLVLLLTLVVGFINRSLLLNLVTDPVASAVLIGVLLMLALGWALVWLDTLRLLRIPLLPRRTRPLAVAALALCLVATSGSLAYAAYLVNVSRGAIGAIFAGGPAIAPVDGRYNFLVMGGDAGADRTGRRPDSLSVLSVDASTGQTALISVPRNFQNARFAEGSPMRTVYPDGYNCGNDCLINAINTEVTEKYAKLYPGVADPGAQATMEAVSGTLGITVQAYVVVDMDGFAQLVDALGGIKVNAGGWVPMSGAALDDAGDHAQPVGWIAPGPQTLDGFHALWYGRSREFASDYDRIARQQCIQQAMINQLNPATVLTKFESIANAGTKVVESNISASQLGSFVDLAIKGKGQPVSRLVIGPPDFPANFPTYPDFDQIQAKVKSVLTAPASPSPKAAGASSRTGGAASFAAPVAVAPAAAMAARAATVPANQYNTMGPDGVRVDAKRLDYLFKTGQNDILNAIMANNGQCTPM
ncbi:LCP family protein [Sinomonas sp. JGH33]|uniref:LCP family protein n=1 Tax=Sinomonas terricola TaxID=3110330 RepID=A0ABU5T982_9MICC|nr:LCP family protein [Sinomonas sp. JGH33]MEA5456205.1 LCP family protein [Sinomonas sp. JGH33]